MRHLGEALDKVRKAEYARLSGKDRRFIKDQKYNLLSRHENLTLEGKRFLKILLAANKRLNTAYVLKEAFGQLWDYGREAWAQRFFDNWRASLKWQRLVRRLRRDGRNDDPHATLSALLLCINGKSGTGARSGTKSRQYKGLLARRSIEPVSGPQHFAEFVPMATF
jgi:hypothetical protein